MSRYLVLGATSAIARALAGEWAEREGADLLFAGRDETELQRLASDAGIRYGRPVRALAFDALDYGTHEAFWQSALADGDLDGVILAVGTSGEQEDTERDTEECRRVLEVNLVACASILHTIAPYFARRGTGTLVVISSVAGDRGRRSNYVYGASKAGLTVFLEGLRARLRPRGVRVVTVKPGFVDTRMTFSRGKLPLLAQPEDVAHAVYDAVHRGKDVIYVPWFWGPIMLVIRALPAGIMARLNF